MGYGSKRPRKNAKYWIELAGILLMVAAMISCTRATKGNRSRMVPMTTKMPKTMSANAMTTTVETTTDVAGTNNCSAYTACSECTGTSSCSWSLDEQSCGDSTQMAYSPRTVYENENCPRYSVVASTVYAPIRTVITYQYAVRVSNDVNGFLAHLRNMDNITCYTDGVAPFRGQVFGDRIVCDSLQYKHTRGVEIRHYYMKIGEAVLRFDNLTHNYVTYYDDTWFCRATPNEYCATCMWEDEDGQHVNRYDRCSASNPCMGGRVFEYLFRRTTRDYWNDDGNGGGENTGVVRVRGCTDLEIEAVEPRVGLWNGGTAMRITVRNHALLAEGRSVFTVTVAGRECAYPTTVDNTTITCTTSPAAATELGSTEGPVEVTYHGGPLDRVAAAVVLSTPRDNWFRFVYPQVTAVRPSCGPTAGGTLLRVDGRSLNASRMALVYVGAANVTCEVIARGPEALFCVTGPSAAAAGPGPATVLFDKSLRRAVPGVAFTYTDDEPIIDPGQRFKGIASGGTTVPVRGTRFACIQNAQLHVVLLSPGLPRRTAVARCAVTNDTYMVCRSPRIPDALSASQTSTVMTDFFFRVEYAGRVLDISPPSWPAGRDRGHARGVDDAARQPGGGYELYSDPEFTDFEPHRSRVAINGRGLDRGYELADVTVRFQNSTGKCVVIRRTHHHILCDPSKLTLRPRNDDDKSVDGGSGGDGVIVTIGDAFEYIVKKKSNRYNPYPLKFFSIFTGIKIFLAITTSLGMVLYCLKAGMQRAAGRSAAAAANAAAANVQYQMSDQFKKTAM